MFFGSAYGWWLQENYNASPSRQQPGREHLWCRRLAEVPAAGRRDALAAVQYYDCGACQYNNPFWQPATGSQNSFGNTTITQGAGTSAIKCSSTTTTSSSVAPRWA